MSRYYTIHWDELNQLPLDKRMGELARIGDDVRAVTAAERIRMAHRAVAAHGGGHGSQSAAASDLHVNPVRFRQITKEIPVSVDITLCTEPDELYRHYPREMEPQPCYVALSLEGERMWADFDAEVSNAVPFDVHHGLIRRYPIPVLTAKAANDLMAEIKPLAERMCSDWEKVWNGSDHVAVLGDDATAAEEEIERIIGEPGYWDRWEDTDMVTVWDVDGATNGDEAEEYGITATTTDERLDEIEEEIRTSMIGVAGSDVVVLEGVDEYLRRVRDEAAEDA